MGDEQAFDRPGTPEEVAKIRALTHSPYLTLLIAFVGFAEVMLNGAYGTTLGAVTWQWLAEQNLGVSVWLLGGFGAAKIASDATNLWLTKRLLPRTSSRYKDRRSYLETKHDTDPSLLELSELKAGAIVTQNDLAYAEYRNLVAGIREVAETKQNLFLIFLLITAKALLFLLGRGWQPEAHLFWWYVGLAVTWVAALAGAIYSVKPRPPEYHYALIKGNKLREALGEKFDPDRLIMHPVNRPLYDELDREARPGVWERLLRRLKP